MNNTKYVSLHNHTTFSIMHSLIKPSQLFLKCKELGQTTVAVTDTNTLAGAWDCLKASKEAGVKLIIGCEFYFVNNFSNEDEKLRHIILLAKNEVGYRNLLLLSKEGYDNAIVPHKKVYSRINWKILEKYKEGLICTTACSSGILGQLINSRKLEEAKEQALRLKNIFGDDLALELQPHAMKRSANGYTDYIDQTYTNLKLKQFGEELGIRCIAATNAHYIDKKESEAHDVLLAIGAGQPMASGNRNKYPVPEFYLKTGDEVKAFFTRLFGEEFAEELCVNSVYLANKCEEPDWIDPKYSNPSGKELPEFPVQDQADFNDFKQWRKDNVKDDPDDVAYLKYRCEKGLEEKGLTEDRLKLIEYRERVKEEIDVMVFHGFSSYMLIVADILDFARSQDIRIGPGRGCLTGDTNVLTDKGFKHLSDVSILDKVYSHTGKLRSVKNAFKYDIDETGYEVYTEFSEKPISLTSDHKVYAVKAIETPQYVRMKKNSSKSLSKVRRWEKPSKPNWFPINELKVNDWIYMPPIDRRQSNVEYNISDEFLYFMGRWVGDGWFYHHKKLGYQVGVAFHSDDVKGIDTISTFLKEQGLNVKSFKHKTKKLVQIKVHNKDFQKLIHSYVPDYKRKSHTKHLPIFFRELSDRQLRVLLSGLVDTDGNVEVGKRQVRRENFDTTSYRLLLEVKEALLYLNVPSNISFRDSYVHGKYKCRQSFKLRFKGLYLPRSSYNLLDSGYLCKITKLNKKHLTQVFDIEVDKDHSYVTSNYAVHNSVGGSLIAYLLDIHVVDPIKYGLLFARFHNKDKTSFPDVDMDFSSREEVDDYVREKYGEECVAHVSTVIALKPRVYAKDIARTFEYGGSRKEAAKVGQAISDTIPDQCTTFEGAVNSSPLFEEYTKRYKELRIYSKYISGKARDWGTHAAGVIISNRPLAGLVPLRRDKHNKILIEYEKERAEENGLVKMDFLGVDMLKVIDNTYALINMLGKTPPSDPIDYEQYDKKTYDLIGEGNTLCVFQLGTSSGTIGLCRQIKPQNIEDLAAINSLARPAAQGIRQDYIDTKSGQKKVNIRYKCLERSLKPTLGFPVYEECLMSIAQDVGGWSLHEADRLRKMTKAKGKYPEKVKAWETDFINGAINKGIKESVAKEVWAMIEKFGSYAFNKSHAVFYGILGFQTAYLKAHYPLEFLTANLVSQNKSNAPKAKTNVIKIKSELRKLNVKIIPPNINTSDLTYKIVDDNTLMTGLDAIKDMTEKSIPEILAKRPFKDLEDFLTKVDGRTVNAKCIKALAACGALDSFGMSRKMMCLYGADYKKKLQVWNKKKPENRGDRLEYPWPTDLQEWSLSEKFALEEEFLGEGFSGTFFDRFPNFFDKKGIQSVTDFSIFPQLLPMPKKKSDTDRYFVKSIKGVIQDFFQFKIKKPDSKLLGRTMCKISLVDIHNNVVGVTVFPDSLEDMESKIKRLYKKELTIGAAVNISGYINWYNEEVSFTYDDLKEYRSSPALPEDRESRKVKLPRAKKKKVKATEIDPDAHLEEVEDELVEEGVVDVDDDISNAF